MKKISAFVTLMAVLVVGFIFIKSSYESSETVIEAIERVRGPISEIIYSHETDNGVVVFYHRQPSNRESKYIGLSSEYVAKTLTGWKWVFGGGHTETESWEVQDGFTAQYFPGTDGTEFGRSPFPMIFGAANADQVTSVYVKGYENDYFKKAELVHINDKEKIWFVFVDKNAGDRFIVIGYDDKGIGVARKFID
ncbi:hypothetical protein [Paenibacillus alkalitolerans]|uniref:hypothetical protein n=1 Tax=Paenibacillus alkalitolerans TaxID=2799335 RepID=UPI0018F59230|nr:hypothetical protein [Paenibacillus alkalitolerans]